MLGFWVPTAFLLFAYSLIFQTSAVGAGAAIGLATGAGRFALGGGKWLGKKGWGAAKESTAGKYLGGKVGMALEKAGLREKGTTAQKVENEIAESRKKADLLSVDKQVEAAKSSPLRRQNVLNKVANIEALAESGNLHRLGTLDEQNQALAYAENYRKTYGLKSDVRKKAEEKDYRLAGFNDNRINQALTAQGIAPAAATPAQRAAARDRVVQEQLRTNLPKMSGSELRNIDYDDIFYNYDLVKENMTPHMIDQFQTATTGPTGLTGALKSHVGMVGATGTLADDLDKAARTGDKAEASRLQKLIDAINRLP
jgi:hypothetical protein